MSNEAIARAWMESPHWGGWRVGMVNLCGQVIGQPGSERPGWVTHGCVRNGGGFCHSDHAELPDLDHPGVRAFLLEDVREAWGKSDFTLDYTLAGDWTVTLSRDGFNGDTHEFYRDFDGPAEAEALLAALQAAPNETRAT